MEEMLQLAPDRKVGDWFLLKEHAIIRDYGFFHEPYILPAFLINIIFSLEFIRQKLTVENKYFINSKRILKLIFI